MRVDAANSTDLTTPWPVTPPPAWANASELCPLVHGKKRLVWGEGNSSAPIALILDNPGAREDRNRVPFVCGTRQTLRQGLATAGIDQNDVYVTFLYKCRPLGAYDRDKAQQVFVPILRDQIRTSPHHILVFLGNTVTQALLGADREVRLLRGKWWEWEARPVCVSYHPLAVRRRPNLFPSFLDDLQMAGERVKFYR